MSRPGGWLPSGLQLGPRTLAGLLGWLVLCYGAGTIGAQFPPGPWYEALAKPAWTPPDAIFAPVWLTLYGLMAVAAWLVWAVEGWSGARLALSLFLVQLVLNAAWSWLFFGLNLPGVALADLLLLCAVVLATLVLFWRTSRLAGLLLAPYMAWISFAAALNFEIWRLNP